MIILDLETTGLDAKKDKIIEFAAIKINENFEEIERLNFFINPEIKISNEVVKLTWITQEKLDKAPIFQEKIPEIEKFLEWDKTIIWHNIQFDIWFLQEWWFLKKNNFLDTFVLSSIFLEKQESYALEVLSDKFKISHEFKHRAIWDVLANLELIKILVWEIQKTNEKFLELIEKNWVKWKYFDFIKKSKIKNSYLSPLGANSTNFKKSSNYLSPPGVNYGNQIFEFSTKKTLIQKIEEFFSQKEKKLIIVPSFLRNFLFEKYKNFPEINLIYWKNFHASEKKFFDLIKDEKNFHHIKNSEIREFFELKIFLAISKNLELNLHNIHISYDEYELWNKILDNEKWIEIWEKNLMDFKTFAELKSDEEIFWEIKDLKKLFIEPEIFFEDKTNFTSLNYVIEKISDEEKKILTEKFENLKQFFIQDEKFSEKSDEEKKEIQEKIFWKYWFTIEIDKQKILEWDWNFFKFFEDKNSDENIAFSTEWRKKAEERWKKFLFELKNFWDEFKKILEWKENFSWMKKNLEFFLESWNSNIFFKFIKISENNISLSAQKIDCISEFQEDFKDSSFWFFWWGLKISENWKMENKKNFNFVKKIYWLKNFDKEIFDNKKLNFSFPDDPYAPWPKNKDFWNFMINQISEICWEKYWNSENTENIWIFVNNKNDLEKIYQNLLENYPDFKIFAPWFSWWKNKIIHNINESEKFILIAQQDFFEKFFTDSEKNINFLIFTKLPFDAPNGIEKKRQDFYDWDFWNYAIPKSLLKTKKIILASWAENVFFVDKRVGSDAWARNYCNI